MPGIVGKLPATVRDTRPPTQAGLRLFGVCGWLSPLVGSARADLGSLALRRRGVRGRGDQLLGAQLGQLPSARARSVILPNSSRSALGERAPSAMYASQKGMAFVLLPDSQPDRGSLKPFPSAAASAHRCASLSSRRSGSASSRERWRDTSRGRAESGRILHRALHHARAAVAVSMAGAGWRNRDLGEWA